MQFSPTQFLTLAVVLTLFELGHSSSTSGGNRADPPRRPRGYATVAGPAGQIIEFQQAIEFEDPNMNFPSGKYWAQLGERGPWVKITDFNPKIQDFIPVMSQHNFNYIDRLVINDWFTGIYTAKNSQRVKLLKRDLNQYEVMTRAECARSRIHKRRIAEIPVTRPRSPAN